MLTRRKRRRGGDLVHPGRQRQRHLVGPVRDPRAARPAAARVPRAAHLAAAARPRHADERGVVRDDTIDAITAPEPVLDRAPGARVHRAGRAPAHQQRRVTGGFARNAVTLLVHLDHQHLLDGLASARLDTGAHVSAGEARRLACSAGIIPVVLGGASQVLDLGRERGCTPRPAPGPLGDPRDLRRGRLRTTLRLVRHPPSARLGRRRTDRPRQRPPALRLPPPTRPRQAVRPEQPAQRRGPLPQETVRRPCPT